MYDSLDESPPRGDCSGHRIILDDGHDAAVRHVPHQDLLVFRHSSGTQQTVIVRERHKRHPVVVLREAVQQPSFVKAPHDDV